MLYVVIFAAGFLIGFIIAKLFMKPKYAGILTSCKSEPNGPVGLYLELERSAEDIRKQSYVIFKVKAIDV